MYCPVDTGREICIVDGRTRRIKIATREHRFRSLLHDPVPSPEGLGAKSQDAFTNLFVITEVAPSSLTFPFPEKSPWHAPSKPSVRLSCCQASAPRPPIPFSAAPFHSPTCPPSHAAPA